MATRISWDKYEVAILIEACEKVNKHIISKNDAISQVSKKLRELATLRGIIIDEVFRNENGISMQFASANGLITKKPSHLSEAKVFKDVADIYLNDKSTFNRILDEANSFLIYILRLQLQVKLRWKICQTTVLKVRRIALYNGSTQQEQMRKLTALFLL